MTALQMLVHKLAISFNFSRNGKNNATPVLQVWGVDMIETLEMIKK